MATYVEAVAFQVRKAGTAAPGASVQGTRASSKPGETPAGAIGREIAVTETFKVRDPKNLEGVQVGDLVDITYTQALAVALDKPAN